MKDHWDRNSSRARQRANARANLDGHDQHVYQDGPEATPYRVTNRYSGNANRIYTVSGDCGPAEDYE